MENGKPNKINELRNKSDKLLEGIEVANLIRKGATHTGVCPLT